MAKVYIPALLREMTDGVTEVDVEANSVRAVVKQLDARFPGIAERLRKGDKLVDGISVSVDGVISNRGLFTPVADHSEVHFIPAIGGG